MMRFKIVENEFAERLKDNHFNFSYKHGKLVTYYKSWYVGHCSINNYSIIIYGGDINVNYLYYGKNRQKIYGQILYTMIEAYKSKFLRTGNERHRTCFLSFVH